MSEIPKLQEPTPEDFGITSARINRFRQVSDSAVMTLIGIPIVAATVYGATWVCSHTFLSAVHPLWQVVGGVFVGVQITMGLQGARVSRAARQPDYPKFASYENAVRNYRNLQRTIRHEANKKRRRQGQTRYQTNVDLGDNDGMQFEIDVVKILFSKRYEVEHTGGSTSGDQGVDFIVRFQGKKIIGQCKAHASWISAGYVRELYGTLIHQQADEAWLVCKTGYHSGAKAFAHGKPIRLMTMRDVERLPDVEKPPVST